MRKPTKQTKKSSKVASRASKGLKPVSAARTVAAAVAAAAQIEFADPFPAIHKPDATADVTAMAPDPQKETNF
jgi:hypothetical protein